MLARTLFDDEHHQFREAVRRFFAAELSPNIARWEAQGQVDKSFWRACGEQGVLCPDMPEAYGGAASISVPMPSCWRKRPIPVQPRRPSVYIPISSRTLC